MTAVAMHWAADLIGRPYSRTPTAPRSFTCWTLVRHVFETLHGIEMPSIDVGEQETPANTAAIRSAAAVSGWRPSGSALPADGDIVLMSGFTGRHVGVIVSANGGLHLLHCMDPVGVCLHSMPELVMLGFRDFEFWRRR